MFARFIRQPAGLDDGRDAESEQAAADPFALVWFEVHVMIDEAGQRDLRVWLRLLACTSLIEARVRRGLRESFDTTLPRFDLMAQEHLGQSRSWRAIAEFNGLDNPLKIASGQRLTIPPVSLLEAGK